MSDGPVFVEKVDVEAMASYLAAQWISEGDEEIWHNDLSEDDRNAWRRLASEAIEAALVGVRPAKGQLCLQQGRILNELDAEVLAWNLGDTFVDFHTMAPQEQWERIVTMIHDHDDWEEPEQETDQ